MKADIQAFGSGRKTANQRQGHSAQNRFNTKWGLIFLSPWIVGFLAFTLIPIIATLIFSFTNYSPVTPESTIWVGLKNYSDMVADKNVANSFLVTIKYAVLALPLSLGFGLLLAALVNSKYLLAKNFFRTIYYMPAMIPVIAAGIIMAGIMNTNTGFINLGLESVGIPGPDWLNSTFWIYPALVLIGLWGLGNLMITLLAGMQGVTKELYESAEIDGANGWQQYLYITLPLISPVIFYNLTIMIIGAFKYFDLAYVLKNGTGGPAGATNFYNLYLYKNAFQYNLMGFGSAMAWVLFVIVLALTVVLFTTSGRWVFYSGGKQ
ncbi:MAG: carbohydrate ABC transporter permease [Anaerolineales bacterium]